MALYLPGVLPNLETVAGRFVLEPFEIDDIGALSAILSEDEIWSQEYGDGEAKPTTQEGMEAFIQRRYGGHRIFSVFGSEPSGYRTLIGTTGITEVHAGFERVKVGRTVLDRRVWGSHANHEIKMALIDWLFSCGAGRIECDVDPRNVCSLRSLIRFGFTVEGVRRRSSPRLDGSWRDIVVLSLLVEEWPSTRAENIERLMDHGTRCMVA